MIWALFLLLGLLQATDCEALTLADLLTRTRVYLKDTSTTRQRFSDSQLTNLLNDAVQDANLRTFAVVTTTRFALISGTTEYSLPTDNIAVLRVTINHVPTPERTFSFFDDRGDDWVVRSTGSVEGYYVRTSSSLVAGVLRESMGFFPRSATGGAHVDYLAQPATLADATDVPFGSDNKRRNPFHHILAYRAAYMGYLTMGDLDTAVTFYKNY